MLDKLKEMLEQRNITQRDLANRAGISEACISRCINGQRKISIEKAYKISLALDMDVGTFINEVYKQ